MTRPQRYTAEEICEAIKGSGGVMAVVARRLECDRSTIGRYAQRYTSVREALHQADEELTDIAEMQHAQLMKAGYWPAIRLRLKTKGKDRGWVERKELTGADGEALQVNVTYASDNTDPA